VLLDAFTHVVGPSCVTPYLMGLSEEQIQKKAAKVCEHGFVCFMCTTINSSKGLFAVISRFTFIRFCKPSMAFVKIRISSPQNREAYKAVHCGNWNDQLIEISHTLHEYGQIHVTEAATAVW
jgi:hypothetical protein